MYRTALERYKKVNGKETIEIRVNSVSQLFDSRDPAPFRERDIDDDFTEYIVASADEIPGKRPIRISILVAQKSEITADAIIEAIRSYFQYQIELKRLQLSKTRRMARQFLLVGIGILALCLGIAKSIESWSIMQVFFFSGTLKEGIVIFGWVSLWRPIELLLFDWYPIYDRIRIFQKILSAEIQVQFENN